MLSPLEITLINALEAGKEYSVQEAAEKSGMKKDTVLKAAHLLREKGYVDVETSVITSYSLTEEGRKCLEEGLPEEKILLLLDKGKRSIKDIEEKLGKKEVGIGLGWLRKKGIIKLEEGQIIIVDRKPLEEKDALKLIAEGNSDEVPQNLIKTLQKRRLLEPQEKKEIYIRILKKPETELKGVIADLTPDILLTGKWKDFEFLKYDIRIPSEDVFVGKTHPYERIISECRRIFLEMGFTEIKGNYIQTAFWNFDALFQPQDHPARDMQDTFYITDDVVLRTHTSPVQIRVMEKNKPPLKVIVPGKVYRCDADISHTPMFQQLEGFMVDKRISMSDLKGVLEVFAHAIFGPKTPVRFRPSFFPFTEPSAEVDIGCIICNGAGCKVCKNSGWIEILGAGMINPRVFKNVGYNPDSYTGFAFGMGIERITMLKYGIDDIRLFFENDKRFLEQF